MPEIRLEDTIAAISTPLGEGGIGIVRLSGPEAIAIVSKLFTSSDRVALDRVPTHTVHFGALRDDRGEVLDQVLVTVFRQPKSYTREDVVEVSAHGSSRVLQKILDALLRAGARHAAPGEFTRRAFLSGRIDLAQAEAVADVIRAKTDRSLQAAVRQMSGSLSKEIQSVKDQLMKLYAHLEAYLDFPDDHLEVFTNEEFKLRFRQAEACLRRLIETFASGELVREGALVVIAGKPNVGKSSLLNALLRRDRAIVSDIPGTTRDFLEESTEIEGFWVRLADTAGFGASAHPLDQAAMARSRKYLEDGDLFLLTVDGHDGFSKADRQIFEAVQAKRTIAVVNKTDLSRHESLKQLSEIFSEESIVEVSARTGAGLDALQKKIAQLIDSYSTSESSVMVTRLRHKRALEQAVGALRESESVFAGGKPLEFVILDLKRAIDALRELIGEVYSEDLLDVVFQEFCIGK